MPNPLQLSGAQPPRPSRKAPLYQAPRWTTGLWTNRSALRDAASTRSEEKYFGPRGDALLGGENIELTTQLTMARRPGNAVWNSNNWTNIQSFYEFRLFNSNIEEIKTMVDTKVGIYDASNNGQQLIWTKASTAGQSYFQSVANCLFWGDGANQKKWINTLQSRIPYVRTGLSQNPYNFTPFNLSSFIIDSNGDAQQLIGTILQLKSFYISNNFIVFTLLTSKAGILLPEVPEVLSPGLELYFEPGSQVAKVLSQNNGVTLTIQNLVGGISTIKPFFGGVDYTVGDVIQIDQSSIGAINGTATVASTITADGTGYVTSSSVPTTTNGAGNGAVIGITALNGNLTGGAIVAGGLGYAAGDLIFPVQIGGSGGYFKVTSVSTGGVITGIALATGVVSALNISASGMGYFTSDQVPTTGGTGKFLTVTITDDQTQFSCPYVYNGGVITSATIAAGGTNYKLGDIITPVEASQPISSGAELQVTSINGAATQLSEISGGPAVYPYFTGPAAYTTSGAGTGLGVNVDAVSSGLVTAITLSGGTGFVVGDLVYVIEGGAVGCTVSVDAVTAGAPTSWTITVGGLTPYTVATGVPTTTSGTGTGLTINITSTSTGIITGFALNAGGTGYAVGDFVYPTQGAASGAVFQVSSLNGGVVTGITLPEGAPYSGYPFLIPMSTTGGSGTGCTIQLQGSIPSVIGVIINGGTGYTVGDNIYPVYSGSSGTLYFTVLSVGSPSGPITAVTVVAEGSGYITANNLPVEGGSGTGALIDLVVSNQTFYPLSLTTDTPTVYTGGNPISDSRTNSSVVWASKGNTTIDGSALWYNRGAVVDNGLIYNWGISSGTQAPSITVNNASAGWQADTYYSQWQFIVVSVGGSNYIQQLTTSGKSGSVAPAWSTTPGVITIDGTARWTCLSNDGDTTLAWTADTAYSVGHVIEETVSSVNCVFQLQPYSGVMTKGTNFPVYCWQCNSQSGSDVGAAGEIPSGSANAPMSPNGTQPVNTATYSGTLTSLMISQAGASAGTPNSRQYIIGGNSTLPSIPTNLFAGKQNLSFVMLPQFVIPEAGTYTFSIGHQNAMFWGIGNGTLEIDITGVEIVGNLLTVTTNTNADKTLTAGVTLTFSGITGTPSFLNGISVTVSGTSGKTFTANYTHADFGPVTCTGTATSGDTLTPSVITGPMNWPAGSSPNHYDFSSGTPVKGYPIMSANYPTSGTSMVVDLVQIDFPSAGVYPAEVLYGYWYHSISGYSTPTVSPGWPSYTGDNKPAFYMIYSPPSSSTFYNIVPQGIVTSSAAAPTWPAFPTTLAGMQALAPDYPSIVEASGNYTWWNLGPATSFGWNASTNYTTSQFIIDTNSNKEVPYEPGVSGSSAPSFGTTLYALTADLSPLVWMNDGPAGSSPSGTVTTTQGGWKYCVSLVNTLDNTVSNASIVSASTGNFFGSTGVFISGGLPAVIDPQVDYVAIFRTDDGGATYYLIPPPTSGNGNTQYTIPLAQYLSQGFTDTTDDANLDTLETAPLAQQNSVAPQGAINCAFQNNRIWVSVGNTVYWSTGPDVPVGNGFNAFDPQNFAEFPSLVKRLVPLNAGLLVFTVSDIYIISGEGTPNSPFISYPLFQRVGLLSYNAMAVNGSIMYFQSTDKQILEINVHSGITHIGAPIADLIQTNFNPANSYLTWHVSGAFDQCLFVADGSTGWYRMSPTAAPESGSITWSTKANIVGGCGAVASVETSPGEIQLLVAPPPGVTGPILYRSYETWEDNGQTYPANFILGSLVFAYPGQVGAPEFITTDCVKLPESKPLGLAIRIGEIAGPFESLDVWENDPPQLPPSNSLYNQRFYLSQNRSNVLCRHAQIFGEFAQTNTPDELYTLTVYGGYMVEG